MINIQKTLRKLVVNLKRTENLYYMESDFPEYAWSLFLQTDVSDILIFTKRARMSQDRKFTLLLSKKYQGQGVSQDIVPCMSNCSFSLMAMRSSKVSKKVPSRLQHRAAIIQLVENQFGSNCGIVIAHRTLQLIGNLIIYMNPNFCRIMLDLTKEQRQGITMSIYGDNIVMLILIMKHAYVIYGPSTSNQASIRRFYISFIYNVCIWKASFSSK